MRRVFDIFEGNESPLSKEVIRTHFKKILVVVLMLMFYIELRYEYEQAVSDLATLKTTLDDERYRNIEDWGELTRRNRPDVIRRRAEESINQQLETSSEPPYMVK